MEYFMISHCIFGRYCSTNSNVILCTLSGFKWSNKYYRIICPHLLVWLLWDRPWIQNWASIINTISVNWTRYIFTKSINNLFSKSKCRKYSPIKSQLTKTFIQTFSKWEKRKLCRIHILSILFFIRFIPLIVGKLFLNLWLRDGLRADILIFQSTIRTDQLILRDQCLQK